MRNVIIHASSNTVNISIPEKATQSLDGFREWVYSDEYPNECKCVYFQKEVFLDMAAERANSHAELKTAITRALGNFVESRDLGKIYGDGMWFTNDQADVSNEPDAMFIAWESLESGRMKLVAVDGFEYQGAPDWALEVVSNSSVMKDTKWLPKAYHLAGVREYWLVDARGDTIDFSLFIWRTDCYIRQVPDNSGWQRSEVFDCGIRLDRQRDRIGSWQYALHLR